MNSIRPSKNFRKNVDFKVLKTTQTKKFRFFVAAAGFAVFQGLNQHFDQIFFKNISFGIFTLATYILEIFIITFKGKKQSLHFC